MHRDLHGRTWCAATAAPAAAQAVTNADGGGTTFKKPFDYIGTKTLRRATGYDDYARDVHLRLQHPRLQPTAGARRCSSASARKASRSTSAPIFDLVNAPPGGHRRRQHRDRPRRRCPAPSATRTSPRIALEVPIACLTQGTAARSSAAGRRPACARRACSTRRATFAHAGARRRRRGSRSRASACRWSTRS